MGVTDIQHGLDNLSSLSKGQLLQLVQVCDDRISLLERKVKASSLCFDKIINENLIEKTHQAKVQFISRINT